MKSYFAAAVGLFALTGCLNFQPQQASCALAADWTVVDDFTYARDTEAAAIAIDGRGVVFVAGPATEADHTAWLVRASGDGGRTWGYSDIFGTAASRSEPTAILAAQSGLLAAGRSPDWLVRRAGAEFWSMEDVGHLVGSGVLALAEDRDGTVLAAGFGSGGGGRWALRMRDPSTGYWSPVSVDAGETVEDARANAVAAAFGTWIVAGGERSRESDGLRGHWLVRLTTDRGATFASVDRGVGGPRTEARAAAASRNGVFYVAGVLEGPGGSAHWTVRRSRSSGAAWETVDDFVPPVGAGKPNAVAVDGDGGVWVAGTAGDRWVVRHAPKDGTWSTVDDFGSPDDAAEARGIAVDRTGAVYAVGRVKTSGQGNRWLVRSLRCAGS